MTQSVPTESFIHLQKKKEMMDKYKPKQYTDKYY